MLEFLKKLFPGGGNGEQDGATEPATEYNGYTITPTPRKGDGGWSTEATITREVDGELLSHHFIRADKTASREGAVELTLNKSRQTIDQIGERLFDQPQSSDQD